MGEESPELTDRLTLDTALWDSTGSSGLSGTGSYLPFYVHLASFLEAEGWKIHARSYLKQLVSASQKDLMCENAAEIFTEFLLAFCLLGQGSNFIAR